jgi:hypothetical protein
MEILDGLLQLHDPTLCETLNNFHSIHVTHFLKFITLPDATEIVFSSERSVRQF